jgi:hypothetical protein
MRIHKTKKGRLILIARCIDCPKLPKCIIGAWWNSRPASGPIHRECPLRKARPEEIEELTN